MTSERLSPVRVMCKMLDVSASGYYAWRGRPESMPNGRQSPVHRGNPSRAWRWRRGRYGSPRVHAALRAEGRQIGRNRVARLMHHHGICARQKRRFSRTTDSSHDFPLAPNLLGRRFTASARIVSGWRTSHRYPTAEGWLYLAVVLDMFSRRVVGWAMDEQISPGTHPQRIAHGDRHAAAPARPAAPLGSRQSVPRLMPIVVCSPATACVAR